MNSGDRRTREAEERRQAEMTRGQEIGARAFLHQTFDPDYVPNEGIAPEERRRRDEYRNRMGAQVPK